MRILGTAGRRTRGFKHTDTCTNTHTPAYTHSHIYSDIHNPFGIALRCGKCDKTPLSFPLPDLQES